MHPKDDEAYPEETVVRFKQTGVFGVIKERVFVKDKRGFLHYLGHIEGKDNSKPNAYWVIYHHEVELEAYPNPPEKNDILINGRQYELWREGKYIGRAFFREDDPVHGDVFLKPTEKEGKVIQQVFVADAWKLISEWITDISDT